MAFLTDLIKQAFTTDPSGNIALRTTIEGNQNISNGSILADQAHSALGMSGAYYDCVTNDYIEMADNATLDFGTGDFSVITWVKLDAVAASEQFLINKEQGGIGYGLQLKTDDLWIRFDDDTVDASAIIGTAVFEADKYYCISCSFDRSGNASAYVNGVLVGTVDISTATGTLSSAGALRFMAETGGTTKQVDGLWFGGGLLDATHTAAQAASIYAAGPDGLLSAINDILPNVVANWPNNGFSETIAYDTTSSTNDGTVSGGVLTNAPSVDPLMAMHSLTIQVTGTASASTATLEGIAGFNDSAIASETVTEGAGGTNFDYTAAGTLTITSFSNAINVLNESLVYNDDGTDYLVRAFVSAGQLNLLVRNSTTGAQIALSDIQNTKIIQIKIAYITAD